MYFAKQVSTEIADVVANTPSPGVVNLYVLMKDGTIAAEEIKQAVQATCSDDTVRPLTDYVTVEAPKVVPYDIAFTYYIPSSAAVGSDEIRKAVDDAVAQYIAWQCGALGRDINPSSLIGLLMQTGVKRVALQKPEYAALRDGRDNTVPQIAAIGRITATNGGYENG